MSDTTIMRDPDERVSRDPPLVTAIILQQARTSTDGWDSQTGGILPTTMKTPDMVQIRLADAACSLCGETESSIVFSGGDRRCALPGLFSVVRCRACDHLFMNPQPVPECIADCYPTDYSPHLATVPGTARESETKYRPWYLRYLPLRYVPGLRSLYYWLTDDHAQPAPDASTDARGNRTTRPRALELGCATGRYLHKLQKSGWEVQGIELCERPAQMAKEAGFIVHHGTLESANLTAETFDLITAWMVIEHVPSPRQTLLGLYRALRPGGQILLSVPNASCWQRYLFGKFWYCWDLPRHLQHFSPSSIRRTLELCGFQRVEIVHHRTLLSLAGSLGILILGIIPGSRLGMKLLKYPEQPRLAIQLLLAPLAILLSLLRQGEGLTVRAFKAGAETEPSDE